MRLFARRISDLLADRRRLPRSHDHLDCHARPPVRVYRFLDLLAFGCLASFSEGFDLDLSDLRSLEFPPGLLGFLGRVHPLDPPIASPGSCLDGKTGSDLCSAADPFFPQYRQTEAPGKSGIPLDGSPATVETRVVDQNVQSHHVWGTGCNLSPCRVEVLLVAEILDMGQLRMKTLSPVLDSGMSFRP